MLYCTLDFIKMELLDDEQLNLEIARATQDYESVQAVFQKMEEEAEGAKPNLNILFSQMNNIEGYIRKAENLLHNYDDDMRVRKSIKNREVNLGIRRLPTKKKKSRILGGK
jgi:hypothetical protein